MQIPIFGRTLRKWRRFADLTERELAGCVMEHGFESPEFTRAVQLANFIRQIEAGNSWPFDFAAVPLFIDSCADCISSSPYVTKTPRIVRKNLAVALASDVLAADAADLPVRVDDPPSDEASPGMPAFMARFGADDANGTSDDASADDTDDDDAGDDDGSDTDDTNDTNDTNPDDDDESGDFDDPLL